MDPIIKEVHGKLPKPLFEKNVRDQKYPSEVENVERVSQTLIFNSK